MSLAAVLFDLDGTLVDTLPICYLAFRRAVDRSGGPSLSDADLHALFGPSEDGMMRRVLPDGWQSALERYFDEYARLLPMCPAIVSELASCLGLLRRRRLRAGLVTGKSRTTAMMSLRHYRLDNVFDAVETGSSESVVKAQAIRGLVERWQVPSTRTVYLGDAATDVLAAREAGVIAAGAAWAYGARAADLQAAGADVVFTDAKDFLMWVESETGPT
jgi:phosphoglycolate phosphatase-like HAD superfamily hydrolase